MYRFPFSCIEIKKMKKEDNSFTYIESYLIRNNRLIKKCFDYLKIGYVCVGPHAVLIF